MKNNTPQLWDEVWKETSPEEDILTLAKEESGIRWQRIQRIVLSKFGSFEDVQVIEIGAGTGTNACLMAKRGAKVTILDYSRKAIQRARIFFERNDLKAEFLLEDALSLPKVLMAKYDISMSFGLTEHFKGDDRIKINKAHFDLLRKGGITFISVPNRLNLPYRLYKFVAEHTGKWKVGEEYPYSRKELRNLCQELGIKEYSFCADSLISSCNLINPLRKIRFRKRHIDLDNMNLRKEKGTSLDQYLSYALVLCGVKP